MPSQASLIRAECTLDRDSCAWRNTSTGDFEWRMATLARRPGTLSKLNKMILDPSHLSHSGHPKGPTPFLIY